LTFGTNGTLFTGISTSSQSNTLPFMISQQGADSGLVASGTCSQLTALIGIGKSLAGVPHPTLQSCCVHAGMYEMSL